MRIRLDDLQLLAAGLDRGVLVLDFVGPARRRHPFGDRVFAVRAPAGVFLDLALLRRLDRWREEATALTLRARRDRDGRLERLELDDGLTRVRLRVTWPVSGRTARPRSGPAPAPAGATPPAPA